MLLQVGERLLDAMELDVRALKGTQFVRERGAVLDGEDYREV